MKRIRCVARCVACVVIVSTALTRPATGQHSDHEAAVERALKYRGCYELRFRQDHDGVAEAVRDIPRRVWLTGVAFPQDPGRSYVVMVMRPAPNHRQSTFEAERWSVMERADSLILTWDNFFSGVQAVIGVSADSVNTEWHGRTFYWTDYIHVVDSSGSRPPEPRGTVTAHRVECY